jgi:hypothetical protein
VLLTKLMHLSPSVMHSLANAVKGLLQRRHVVNDLLVAVSYRTDLLANLNHITGTEALLGCQYYSTTPMTDRDNLFLVEDG